MCQQMGLHTTKASVQKGSSPQDGKRFIVHVRSVMVHKASPKRSATLSNYPRVQSTYGLKEFNFYIKND